MAAAGSQRTPKLPGAAGSVGAHGRRDARWRRGDPAVLRRARRSAAHGAGHAARTVVRRARLPGSRFLPGVPRRGLHRHGDRRERGEPARAARAAPLRAARGAQHLRRPVCRLPAARLPRAPAARLAGDVQQHHLRGAARRDRHHPGWADAHRQPVRVRADAGFRGGAEPGGCAGRGRAVRAHLRNYLPGGAAPAGAQRPARGAPVGQPCAHPHA